MSPLDVQIFSRQNRKLAQKLGVSHSPIYLWALFSALQSFCEGLSKNATGKMRSFTISKIPTIIAKYKGAINQI